MTEQKVQIHISKDQGRTDYLTIAEEQWINGLIAKQEKKHYKKWYQFWK